MKPPAGGGARPRVGKALPNGRENAKRVTSGTTARKGASSARAKARPRAGAVQDRRSRPSSGPRRTVGTTVGSRKRVAFLGVLLFVLLTAFAGRLAYVQVIKGPEIAEIAQESRLSTFTITGSRGQITDATGVVLASSVPRYDVSVNQRLIPLYRGGEGIPAGAVGVAQLLAPILEMNEAELGGQLVGDHQYRYVKKGVTPQTAREIAAMHISGINVEQVSQRVYPNGSLAGDVIGFTNSRSVGLQGLESSLNERLTGTEGERVYERGGTGHAIPGGYESGTAAIDGWSVQLTLRNDIQWAAQDAITRAVEETGADSGQIVVMRPTGEILAIADDVTIDPNDPGTDATGALASTVSNVFEPGSTGKVVTMAAALETGVVTPTSQFQVDDTYTVGSQTFHDSHEHEREHLTTTGILAESSNTGTVQVGQRMTAQTQYEFMSAFGFGDPTGIEMPGESQGILHDVADWDGRTRYTVLFGQGVSVTAVQAASVFATVANGGVRVNAHLIAGWTDPDGNYHREAAPASTRVISEQTATQLSTMLESVVDDGTGATAAVVGYRVAGKTGTAQNGSSDRITASFIGYAPADDPQVVVAVILENPSSSIYGGVVAAPVFSEVTGYALTTLEVPPSGVPAQLYPNTW